MDLTPIIQALLALFAAVVTTFLIPWLKGKTTESQFAMMAEIVRHGVLAAEQLYNSGQGAQKKQYVLDYLSAKGYTIDDAVIEGTVKSLFGKSETAVTSGEFAEVE